MKKAILCSMLLAIVYISFSQQTTTSPTLTKQDYLLKSKHQKTAAWILSGAGVLSTSLGSVQTNPDYGGSDNSGSTVLLVSGLTAIGGSIILFVASSKNKKKAMSMSFKTQSVPQLINNNFVYRYTPSLNLKIKL